MRSLTLPNGDASCFSISAHMFHPPIGRREFAGLDLLQAFFHGARFAPCIALIGGAADNFLLARDDAIGPGEAERAQVSKTTKKTNKNNKRNETQTASSSTLTCSASFSSAATSFS